MAAALFLRRLAIISRRSRGGLRAAHGELPGRRWTAATEREMAHFGRDPDMAADARTNARSSVNIPRRLRILIADDHDGFRNELQDTLTCEPDFQVVAAESNGADAVRRVRALRPHGLDLVLMDIDMPVMNGIEVVAEIAETDPDL